MSLKNGPGGSRYFWRLVLLVAVVSVSGWLFYRHGPDGLEFEWLMEPQFYDANSFYRGVAWVQEKEGGPYKLIDKKGRAVVSDFLASYIFANPFTSNLATFCGPGNLMGYVDLTGKVVVPPRYQYAGMIEEGVGVVKSGDLCGVIDEKGRIVLPIMYEEFIFIFDANLFGVKSGDKWGYVNGRNEAIRDFMFDKPSTSACPKGTCVAVLNGKSGLLDRKGRWVLPASYDVIYGVVRGEAKDNPKIGVCRDGKVGFVDMQGNTVIDFQFRGRGWRNCYRFSEGLASVAISDPWSTKDAFGVIDETGKVLFRFSEMPYGVFGDGYMLVQGNLRREQYKGMIVVRDDEATYSLIDRTGKRHPLPTWLEPMGGEVVNGTLLVRVRQKVQRYEDGKYGYLSIPTQ
nr:WG repeat-containing protein [uncultured Fretibacterium sp.]